MYVIFPADELIYMTYGAAVPRIKSRPTLDNLREPLVPFTNITSTTITTISTQPNYSSHPNNPYPTSSYPAQNNTTQYSHNSDAYTTTSRDKRSSSRSSINRSEKKSDIFGYTSTRPESREPSASDQYSAAAYEKTPLPITDKNGKQPGKSKNRLHLSLGRLGRSKNQPPPEPARLRDITEIRIANPTFTRENLSNRNYDAFFESGEPVYSLEYRTPVTTPVASIDSDTFDNGDETNSQNNNNCSRPHSLGIFNRAKSTVAFRSKSSDPMSRVSQKGDRCPSQQLLF